jgi:argininosuccinate synthase
MDRIVLAYSGGPASSVAIPWLREQFAADVVTVTVDLGQREPLDGIRVRALASGAVRAHVLDRRDVFARDHVLPAVQAGAMDIDSDDVVLSLAVPLIAHALAEIAGIEGTRTVAHVAAGLENRDRIAASVKAIDTGIDVIDVANRWALRPDDISDYARDRGIPLAGAVSGDSPVLARPSHAAAPVQVTIDFRAGVPVKINGVEMDLVELLTSLDTIAAVQGVAGSVLLGVAFRALQQRAGSATASGIEKVNVAGGVCEVVTHV